MCYNEINKFKEVTLWLIKFPKNAFPAALALRSALSALSPRAIPSMSSTRMLASSAVLVQMLAL